MQLIAEAYDILQVRSHHSLRLQIEKATLTFDLPSFTARFVRVASLRDQPASSSLIFLPSLYTQDSISLPPRSPTSSSSGTLESLTLSSSRVSRPLRLVVVRAFPSSLSSLLSSSVTSEILKYNDDDGVPMVNKILEFVPVLLPRSLLSLLSSFPLELTPSLVLRLPHLQQGRTEGNRKVDCYQRSRPRNSRHPHRRGRLRSMPFGHQGRANSSFQGPPRTREGPLHR